ncbi:Excinuclease ABC, C subunit-like [hydrothermal vent metagenome]|uniref:Excinuclease ABC, C subunit-like n=1 Tax=hydrothermal vent metagenome TaxID=652676 RepID=A0A3B0R641_9ZZZZ
MKQANGPNIYFTYILASKKHGTLYIGVTRDLLNRTINHRDGAGSQFTQKYGVSKLVYFEAFENVTAAIQREKTMKKWKRDWKINTIERDNPEWVDLFPSLISQGAF